MAIEVDTSLSAEWVILVLEQVVTWRGRSPAIRLDNWTALLAGHFVEVVYGTRRRVTVHPTRHAQAERIH